MAGCFSHHTLFCVEESYFIWPAAASENSFTAAAVATSELTSVGCNSTRIDRNKKVSVTSNYLVPFDTTVTQVSPSFLEILEPLH